MSTFAMVMIMAGSALLGAVIVATAFSGATHGTLAACRAANPGYECGLGWVKTEAFK